MSELVKGLNEAIDRQSWIDRYAVPLQKAVNTFYQSTGKAGRFIADFLNGVWIGHPLHPVITDVPIGAWTAALVLDSMAAQSNSKGLQRGADMAVGLGVAGAVGAAVSGLTDWQHTVGESRRTGMLHAAANTLALTFFVGSMISRASGSRSSGRSLALAGYLIAGVGAYLGGDLVFRQKIGVNHAPDEVKQPEFTPVLDAAALPENTLTRAMLKDTPIVLLRRGVQVYALAEVCAHLGGPLSEGKLGENEQGHPTVTCPWHNSVFDMTSGSVVHGPSAYPQPCFEARITGGQVMVRKNMELQQA